MKKFWRIYHSEIEPGEKVAFFGGDGSGKSTLVIYSAVV
jgi:ABC-type multidrug transport system fused ATPase/permease subunit